MLPLLGFRRSYERRRRSDLGRRAARARPASRALDRRARPPRRRASPSGVHRAVARRGRRGAPAAGRARSRDPRSARRVSAVRAGLLRGVLRGSRWDQARVRVHSALAAMNAGTPIAFAALLYVDGDGMAPSLRRCACTRRREDVRSGARALPDPGRARGGRWPGDARRARGEGRWSRRDLAAGVARDLRASSVSRSTTTGPPVPARDSRSAKRASSTWSGCATRARSIDST